ncbi:MAG: hypothetical protein ACRDD7_13465 [Peptostreptococcaceae bacterium]
MLQLVIVSISNKDKYIEISFYNSTYYKMALSSNKLEEFSYTSILEHLNRNNLKYCTYIVHNLDERNIVDSTFEKTKSTNCRFVFDSVDTYKFINDYTLKIKHAIIYRENELLQEQDKQNILKGTLKALNEFFESKF